MAQVLPPFAEKVPFISSNDVLEKCVAFVAEQGGARPASPSNPEESVPGSTLCLEGPRGCGKSRVLSEVLDRIGDDAFLIASECQNFTTRGLFSCFETAIRRLLEYTTLRTQTMRKESLKMRC